MEVLLLQDVNGIGLKDDLLIVGDGYALNFLLPQSKALIATPTVRRRYADRIRSRAEEKQLELAAKHQAAKVIADKKIIFERKATTGGKLYAAITEAHIAEALKEQHKMDIAENAITIAEPIKTVGEFAVTITLADSQPTLTVIVTEEK